MGVPALARSVAGSAARILAVARADAQSLSRSKGWGLERTVFAGILVAVVAIFWPKHSTGSLDEMSRFGEQAFASFYLTAYILTGLLVAVLYGGAFAPERRGGNALLLFTTPLRPFEIVLGRFASHTTRTLVVLACGAPILFSTLLFGGVSGTQVLMAVGSLLLFAFLTGSLTFLFSALVARSHLPGLITVLVLLGEMLAVGAVVGFVYMVTDSRFLDDFFVYLILMPQMGLAAVVGDPRNAPGAAWIVFSESAALGCLFLVVSGLLLRRLSLRAGLAGGGGSSKRKAAPPAPPVRPAAPPEAVPGTVPPSGGEAVAVLAGAPPAPPASRKSRGPVWINPVAWKEVKVRGSPSTVVRVLTIVGLAIGVPVLLLMAARGGDEAQGANAIALCVEIAFFGLGAAALAGSAVSREREEEKLDLLAVTPLTASQIWTGKWAGVARGMAFPGILLALHLLLWAGWMAFAPWRSHYDQSVLCPLLAVVLHAASAAGIASWGLLVSLHAKKSASAIAVTLLGVVAWWVGLPILFAALDLEDVLETAGGFNPFVAAVSLEFGGRDIDKMLVMNLAFLAFAALVWVACTLLFFLRFPRMIRK
jgi:ABC-type transport system involved in multi-copper enzyme maturation permease subunit